MALTTEDKSQIIAEYRRSDTDTGSTEVQNDSSRMPSMLTGEASFAARMGG